MHVISTRFLDRAFVLDLLATDAKIKYQVEEGKWEEVKTLPNHILAAMFFEPSTRTRLSFETAMKRLGGSVLSVTESDTTSLRKGESLQDNIKTVGQYADVIVVRHPDRNALVEASRVSDVPLINAGNGDGEHPTQALLDLFTIQQELGTIDGLNIMFLGDLRHSRTAHSLLNLLQQFEVTAYLAYPKGLGLEDQFKWHYWSCKNKMYEDVDRFKTAHEIDVFYLIRPQKERWPAEAQEEFENKSWKWPVESNMLHSMKKKAVILHPLPRNEEIPEWIEEDKRCAIWRQVKNGIYTRMALLPKVLQLWKNRPVKEKKKEEWPEL